MVRPASRVTSSASAMRLLTLAMLVRRCASRLRRAARCQRRTRCLLGGDELALVEAASTEGGEQLWVVRVSGQG